MSESDDILYRAGHMFPGPDGQAYRLLTDVQRHTVIRAIDFLPVGGAPEPAYGEVMPDWLVQQIVRPRSAEPTNKEA